MKQIEIKDDGYCHSSKCLVDCVLPLNSTRVDIGSVILNFNSFEKLCKILPFDYIFTFNNRYAVWRTVFYTEEFNIKEVYYNRLKVVVL